MDQDKLLEDIIAEKDTERARILVEVYKSRLEEASQRRRFWSNPILISLTGGVASVLFGIWTNHQQHQNALALEREQHNLELAVERERAVHQMVRDAIGPDPVTSEGNLRFLSEAGLLGDFGSQIAVAANTYGPRRERAAADAIEPAELVMQVGSFSLRRNAERLIADHLAELPVFILKKRDLYAVLIRIDSFQAGQELIETLPEAILAQQPFMRRISDMCDAIGAAPAADAAAGVRACLVAEAE